MTDTILITGGAGALGSVVARELASRGARVALVDTPHGRAKAEALAKELSGISLVFDASKEADWKSALEKTGPVAGAALIAGTWAGGKPIHELKSDETADKMHAVNFDTAYRSLRALLPGMVANKRGSIVVVGSRAVVRPWESAGAALYAASKAAVVTMAQAAAAEVLQHGVRINAVLPSTIDTEANRAAMPKADPSRWVSAASLAKTIAFLLSEDARDITGATIPVYGRV
jgi:NAD(P)-dependent dehydrogenase (short-subunit alcohol dehydrogenase family)